MTIIISLSDDNVDMPAAEVVEIRPGVTIGGVGIAAPVRTTGNDATLRNFGKVLANSLSGGFGVDTRGETGIRIENRSSGEIFGSNTGVDLAGNALLNAGTIEGNGGVVADAGSSIANTGAIGGSATAIRTAGALTNGGLIYGDLKPEFTDIAAISLTGTGQTIVNSGTIQGGSRALFLGTDTTLQNTGIIQGDVEAGLTIGVSADRIVNAGTIAGDIALDDGNDRYDGRLGKLFGFADLGNGDDTALGGEGDEFFRGGLGNDLVNGGAGSDTALFLENVNTTVNLSVTGPQATGEGLDTLIGFENVTTGNGNDKITGTAGNNIFDSGEGNDTLSGGAGDDVLRGSFGSDTAAFTGTVAAIVNLTLTTAQNTGHGFDTLQGIEHLTGGTGNDSFTGDALANILNGLAGNDTLTGEPATTR